MEEFGGQVKLNISWAKSFLKRIDAKKMTPNTKRSSKRRRRKRARKSEREIMKSTAMTIMMTIGNGFWEYVVSVIRSGIGI